MMRWYYFVVEAGAVRLPTAEELGERPDDAQDDGGNPHTPWYQAEDHWDSEHIHIKADSLEAAWAKAHSLLGECLHIARAIYKSYR